MGSFHQECEPALTFERDARVALIAAHQVLVDYCPQSGRPHTDTHMGSRIANMKELRFEVSDGEWRADFAFCQSKRPLFFSRQAI